MGTGGLPYNIHGRMRPGNQKSVFLPAFCRVTLWDHLPRCGLELLAGELRQGLPLAPAPRGCAACRREVKLSLALREGSPDSLYDSSVVCLVLWVAACGAAGSLLIRCRHPCSSPFSPSSPSVSKNPPSACVRRACVKAVWVQGVGADGKKNDSWIRLCCLGGEYESFCS